jgi:hypothetical protein
VGIFKRFFQKTLPKVSLQSLRPNCLLTRYPICFIPGEGGSDFKKTYWNGVPEYLNLHGYETHVLRTENQALPQRIYEVSNDLKPIFERSGRVHLLTYSTRAMDALALMANAETKESFSSVTLVNPEFLSGPEILPVLTQFVRPEKVMFGTILTTNHPQSIPSRISQQVAKSLGPVFREYPSMMDQNVGYGMGRGMWQHGGNSAPEMYLDHCIFLAEYDLTHAE